MPNTIDLRSELARIASMKNETARAAAYEDLCLDAESLLSQGRKGEAVPIFEVLSELDENDDLLGFARRTAIENLEDLGVRPRPSLEQVANRLLQQFAQMPEQLRLVAVAKTLHREFGGRQREANERALEYLEEAEKIGPLPKKDQRLLSELRHQIGSGT